MIYLILQFSVSQSQCYTTVKSRSTPQLVNISQVLTSPMCYDLCHLLKINCSNSFQKAEEITQYALLKKPTTLISIAKDCSADISVTFNLRRYKHSGRILPSFFSKGKWNIFSFLVLHGPPMDHIPFEMITAVKQEVYIYNGQVVLCDGRCADTAQRLR